MGLGIAYKILKSHLVGGNMVAGESIDVKIDQTLTQDATGTMAYLQFESLGLDHIRNGFENADDHRYLQSVAEAKGIVFSRPGNGICHQVHLECFGAPGKTLIGLPVPALPHLFFIFEGTEFHTFSLIIISCRKANVKHFFKKNIIIFTFIYCILFFIC